MEKIEGLGLCKICLNIVGCDIGSVGLLHLSKCKWKQLRNIHLCNYSMIKLLIKREDRA
jgi:hypothetical protein